MRIAAIAAAVAAVSLAQVGAVPLRVVVLPASSSNRETAPSFEAIRFGHAAAPLPSGVEEPRHAVDLPMQGMPRMRRPCGGARVGRFRQKAVEISNAFRNALGWPLIDTDSHAGVGLGHSGSADAKDGVVHILPWVGTPNTFIETLPGSKDGWVSIAKAGETVQSYRTAQPPLRGPHHHHDHHHHDHHPHHPHHGPSPFGYDESFLTRMHYSLMNLGPWEGRAVAFVLGCGIGVLLRMFWVIAIVTYRVVKGQREDQDEYSHITDFEEEDEDEYDEVLLAPPIYTYPVDEKAPIEAETVKAAPATTEESK